MTEAGKQAGEFLERSGSLDILNVEDLLTRRIREHLGRINSRVDLAAGSKRVLLCRITSADSALDRYAKWKAMHLFLTDKPGLLEQYYAAEPETPYTGGDEHVQSKIETGAMHPSIVHLWEFGVEDPASGNQYIFKHLPGEDNHGWEYRLSVMRRPLYSTPYSK